ncbi:MAG: hypothetical protein BAA01_10255 [Bacillus thermozeamaize]|uniref:Uncharacterized protein n=1 Tax=Bacillus thermozeamaize TaxID=230954 RepID=A0A1Y3PX84_9BACI|nr:MAG: hypothetical protein BAA01_10255 [Bacillus thermozeamaize]
MHYRTKAILDKAISDEIKVVSFDIFDTLLVRPVISPTDLFKIVGLRTGFDSFKEMRIIAEQSARKKKPFYEDDITFEDIYEEFSNLFGIDEEAISVLKETELEVEREYLRPRKTLREIFYAAKEHNKEIIITSDMYLPREFLESVLEKNGYIGYDRFYLSSEEKLSKGTGRLFSKIIADYEAKGIAPHEILHIGDNQRADIANARKYKIQACHVPSTISILRSKKRLYQLFQIHTSMDNSFLVGYIANTLFDDPFHPFDINSCFGEDVKNIGIILLAPLLLAFTKWMLEDAIKEEIEKLSFVYRDGYIPLKIYNILSKCYNNIPETNVIYLTRAMRYNYFANEQNGFYKVFKDLPPDREMTVEQFVKTRLLVEEQSEMKEVLSIFEKYGFSGNSKFEEFEQNFELFREIEPYFIKNAKNRISDLDQYWKSILNPEEKLGVFDVGYRGSVSRFLKDQLGLKNVGYHLFASPVLNAYVGKRDYTLKTFIQYGISTIQEAIILHHFIEDVISSQEGSVIHIRPNKEGFEFIRQETQHYNERIAELQDVIIRFSEEFTDMFKADMAKLVFDGFPYFNTLVDFLRNPYHKDAKLIYNWSFEDSNFISTDNNSVYVKWYNQKLTKNNHQIRNNIKQRYYSRLQEHFAANPGKSKIRIMIYLLLLKMGLLPITKKIVASFRGLIANKKNDPTIKELERRLSELQDIQHYQDRELILVAGHMVLFDKGTCEYLNQISRKLKNVKMLLLCEATRVDESTTKKLINFDFIKVPKFLGKDDDYPKNINVKIGKEIINRIKEKKYLALAADNLKTRHPDMGKGYAEAVVYYADQYFRQLLSKLNPKKVVLWNKFHAIHLVLYNVCKEMGIKTVFMEFGLLPGTIVVEEMGQMGESFPAVKYQQFMNLDVNDQDLAMAERVIKMIRDKKLNRNIQPINNMKEKLLSQLIKDRAIIFYAGQNDFESGMYPYTEETKKYHSPIFKTSDEAALYLSALAKKNKWNFIYKPHPLIYRLRKSYYEKLKVENMIVVSDIDINDLVDMADLTITILSQTGYVSLIRNRPTLMLGYTQLRGKGCTYEAFTLEEIEQTIKSALQNGFTESQQYAFKKHVAQLLKYYLYDDLVKKDFQYGMPLEECVKFLLTGERTVDCSRSRFLAVTR